MLTKQPLYEFSKILLACVPASDRPYCDHFVLELPGLAKTHYKHAIKDQKSFGGDPYIDMVDSVSADQRLPAYVRGLFMASADACENPGNYPHQQRYMLYALRSTMDMLVGYARDDGSSSDKGGELVPA